ncbi:hypothetical protein BU16DRAFT_49782 [Lophium mytilinum]|uniref:Rhodopsin domain-containing protein n=1 Tax=Lophium mytilinum TaxID=390894 RepID=A0A6A6QQT6_9PEZI|nr:hypothetical protein BU16DRAFT_49782 [Lophium mytilinum]
MAVDISHTPATTPPQGVTAEFEHPDSIAYQVIALSLPFTCTATVVVLLRMYTRIMIVRSPGLDDLTIVIGLLISWIFCALGIANIPYGYGIHLWDLYIPKIKPFLIIDLLGQDFYFVGTCFVKVSILLFYLRLNPDKTFRRVAFAIMSFDVVYSFVSIIVATFGCTPIAGGWDLLIKSKCVNKKAYYYVAAACNIVTDFATLGLPVRMCLRLNVSRRQRWLLLGLFGVGSFACIISIVRLVTMLPSLHSIDFTRYKVQVAGWAEVEINTGIICACLPTLKPLLNTVFPTHFAPSSGRTPASSSPSSNPSKRFRDKQIENFSLFSLRSLNAGTHQQLDGEGELGVTGEGRGGPAKLDDEEGEFGRVPSYVGWGRQTGRRVRARGQQRGDQGREKKGIKRKVGKKADGELELGQGEGDAQRSDSVQRIVKSGGVAKTTEYAIEIEEGVRLESTMEDTSRPHGSISI